MARARYPSDDMDKLLLRFPQGMRQQIADRAKANFRSMNGEVIAILAQALGGEAAPAADQAEQPAAERMDRTKETAPEGVPAPTEA